MARTQSENLDDKSKDKLKSHSINFDGNVDLTAVASDALVNKGTVAGAAATNLNGGRISMNNNNDSSIHDKNATSKPFGLGGGGGGVVVGDDDAFNGGKTNGNGTGNGTATQNNGKNLDNFADFDAFASVTQKDFDPFASADAFSDPIGLSSTHIDSAVAGTKTIGAISNKSAKDRFFSDSLGNTTTPTKHSIITTATALTADSNGGGTNGSRRSSQSRGVTINDYFDAKFDSFMTTTTTTTKSTPKDDSAAAADLANANNSNKTKASPFGLDDNDFADFNNANTFKTAFDTTDHAPTNSMSTTQFDMAFQPSPNSTIKSTKSASSTSSAFLPLPPPAGKAKHKSTTKSNTSAVAAATAFDGDNKKSAKAATTGPTVATDEPDKAPTKFRNDYSKTDQFEDDLQEVLNRSIVDQ